MTLRTRIVLSLAPLGVLLAVDLLVISRSRRSSLNPAVRLVATTAIPIVAIVADPVANGITTSLARPEGNITGVVSDAGIEIWGKHLALLAETVPALSKVGFIILNAPFKVQPVK